MRVRIESLAYGPHGVARVDGKVHFVRGAAPGDEVEIAVREDRGSFAWADVVAVVAAGPDRREAPCPYLPRCGGCPWQHVSPGAQAAAKEAIVRDLLARVGGVADPPVEPIAAAPAEFGYRRRLSLRVGGGRVGFRAGASHELVPVDECLLAAPALRGAIRIAQPWIAGLRTRIERIEIAATGLPPAAGVAAPGRFVLVGQADGAYAPGDAEVCERLLAGEPGVAGVVLHGRGWRHAWGDDRVRVPLVGGDDLELRAGDFTQVSDAGNAAMQALVLEWAAVGPGDLVADLYAGAGNLSIPLARRARGVLSVERVRSSADAARANASRLGLDALRVEPGDVPRVLDGWLASDLRPDVAVLDPPRNGAADAIDRLVRLGPRTIVYVSCDPATLARDVRAAGAAYRLERARPFDFFPQTYHVETVARLVRR